MLDALQVLPALSEDDHEGDDGAIDGAPLEAPLSHSPVLRESSTPPIVGVVQFWRL